MIDATEITSTCTRSGSWGFWGEGVPGGGAASLGLWTRRHRHEGDHEEREADHDLVGALEAIDLLREAALADGARLGERVLEALNVARAHERKHEQELRGRRDHLVGRLRVRRVDQREHHHAEVGEQRDGDSKEGARLRDQRHPACDDRPPHELDRLPVVVATPVIAVEELGRTREPRRCAGEQRTADGAQQRCRDARGRRVLFALVASDAQVGAQEEGRRLRPAGRRRDGVDVAVLLAKPGAARRGWAWVACSAARCCGVVTHTFRKVGQAACARAWRARAHHALKMRGETLGTKTNVIARLAGIAASSPERAASAKFCPHAARKGASAQVGWAR
eukprot:2221495-Prymnesium_polylepis.3